MGIGGAAVEGDTGIGRPGQGKRGRPLRREQGIVVVVRAQRHRA